MSAGKVLACTASLVGAGWWAGVSSRSQVFGQFPYEWSIEGRPVPGGPVALTFDDGPNEPYTSRLLDLLGSAGARATFFQVGRAVQRDPDITRAVVDAGHVVGNHSQNHELHRCLTPGLLGEELARSQDVLGEVLGRRPALYRPPWLVRTPATFGLLDRHGLTAVSGTFCHPLETARAGPRAMTRSAVKHTRAGSILIFHDGYNGRGADRGRTLDAVARTVDQLSTRGYRFVTVDEMLHVPAYQPA